MDLIIRTPDILEAAKILAGALLGRTHTEPTAPALPAAPAAQLPPPAAPGAPVPPGWPMTQEQFDNIQRAAQFCTGMPPTQPAAAPAVPVVPQAPSVPQQYTPVSVPVVPQAPAMPQQYTPPAPTMPPAAAPQAAAPTYTLDQLSRAGTQLVDSNRRDKLLELLAKYGVQALTMLPPAQYGAFATELRALGVQF